MVQAAEGLNNDECQNLRACCRLNVIRGKQISQNEMNVACNTNDRRNIYRILARKPEGRYAAGWKDSLRN